MKKIIVLTAMVLMTAMCVFAQGNMSNSSMKTTQTKTTKSPKASKMMPKDDAGITACINEKLGKSKMANEGFQVAVSDGAATFTGSTKVAGHKGGVSSMAKSCGAKSVVNNITIEGKPSVPKTPKTPKTSKTLKTGATTPPQTN
ncbi:MAG: BON domain-containing protein [Pyrinomonadaceae bacterium]